MTSEYQCAGHACLWRHTRKGLQRWPSVRRMCAPTDANARRRPRALRAWHAAISTCNILPQLAISIHVNLSCSMISTSAGLMQTTHRVYKDHMGRGFVMCAVSLPSLSTTPNICQTKLREADRNHKPSSKGLWHKSKVLSCGMSICLSCGCCGTQQVASATSNSNSHRPPGPGSGQIYFEAIYSCFWNTPSSREKPSLSRTFRDSIAAPFLFAAFALQPLWQLQFRSRTQ